MAFILSNFITGFVIINLSYKVQVGLSRIGQELIGLFKNFTWYTLPIDRIMIPTYNNQIICISNLKNFLSKIHFQYYRIISPLILTCLLKLSCDSFIWQRKSISVKKINAADFRYFQYQ